MSNLERIEELEHQFADLNKKVEQLEKQLKEANEIIGIYRIYDDTECGQATEYCEKWGVK